MREVHGIFPQQLLGLTLPNGQWEGDWLPPGPPHSGLRSSKGQVTTHCSSCDSPLLQLHPACLDYTEAG